VRWSSANTPSLSADQRLQSKVMKMSNIVDLQERRATAEADEARRRLGGWDDGAKATSAIS